jgi:SAM-dependent methyltransferase
MELDLNGSIEGVPERFVPETMRGSLLDAEHRARYWWAAKLVRDARVLDAGCGLAYGSTILAEAGASEVIGVDNAEPVVEAAQARVPEKVRLEQGDVARLRFRDDSFDVVVCFEVIEHVDDTDAVLDEFRRVLRPGGLLAISSPNRDAYPPGNPHHVHEFQPPELRQALEERFAHVRIVHQHDYLTSAILESETFTATDGIGLDPIEVRKVVASRSGREAYTLALASDQPLPDVPRTAVLTETLEVRKWLDILDAQQRQFERQESELAELQTMVAERASLIGQLEEAERRAADRLDLMESLTHAEALLLNTENRLRETEQQVAEARRVLDDVVRSASWKLTAPLRRLKRLLGGA